MEKRGITAIIEHNGGREVYIDGVKQPKPKYYSSVALTPEDKDKLDETIKELNKALGK